MRAGEDATGELARLAAAPEAAVLRPRPLSTEATAKLCEQRLGAGVAPAFSRACREATGGNPFYLEALLREASEQGFSTDARAAARVRGIGPGAVAQAMLLRLSGRPAAIALVRALAVLGDGASVAEAADLAGLGAERAGRVADELVALAILRPAEGLEFAHPIVREAVRVDMGSRERGEAHARAALLLSVGGASEERIAAQVVGANPAGDAGRVELLRRVGADALARGAPAAAVAWLTRAWAEPPPQGSEGELLFELGSTELRLGGAEPLVGEPARAAQQPADPPGRLKTLLAASCEQRGPKSGFALLLTTERCPCSSST